MKNKKSYNTVPQTKETIQALWRLEKIILDTLDFNQVVQRIVDGLLDELGYLDLGYRIIVLTLVNEDKQVLERISLSSTPEAKAALEASAVPFKDIEIPLDTDDNLLIKTLKSNKPHIVHEWPKMFNPVLTAEEALTNQKAAGIKTSMLYPVVVHDKTIGVIIFSMVKDEKEVSEDEKDLIRGFSDVVGLAVTNSRLYSSLEDVSKKLKSANQRLKELDQMKDDFVSVASHELRTPMTAIKSYLWMALSGKGGKLTKKQEFYLERSYKSTDRLIKLVNDMLNISRIESGRLTVHFDKVNLVDVANEVLDAVKPHAEELKVKVSIKKAKIPDVVADADKIKEVFFNLIGNSLKFTPEGGSVTLSFEEKDGKVICSVKDTGRGIAAQDLPTLFRKFGMVEGSYATNKKASGTGLGLFISKSIVEMHGGEITPASEGIDKGSTFSFSLPVYKKGAIKKLEKMNKGKINKGKEEKGIIHTGV